MFKTHWKPLCASVVTLVVGAGLIAAQPEKKPAPAKPDAQPTQPAKPDIKPVVPAKPDKPPAQPGKPTEGDMVARRQATEPSPAHLRMARRVGEYTTTSRFSMPGAPEQTSKGTAKLTMILGGRFLSEDGTGDMMGMPYTSLKLVGYNNETRKYEAVWAYTQSTAMMTMTGTSDDDGKTVTFTASVDKQGGKETFTVKKSQTDDDHFSVEMVTKMPDGSAGPSFVTEYERKK